MDTNKQRRRIECWYDDYWAQSWYRNTYLVNHPRQIARELRGERDWNNLFDSGCNFVCVSIALGIEPSRLASLLGEQRFFAPDRETPARNIAGRIVSLVWDQNEPQERHKVVRLRHVWLPRLRRRATITLRFVGEEITFDHCEGRRIVARARRCGQHIIAGSSEHSHLVAGRTRDDFYLWDPDDTSVAVEDSLAGRLTLGDLFRYYTDEPIEFWKFAVERRFEPIRKTAPKWHYAR